MPPKDPVVISCRELRRAIGLIGIALPVVLVFGENQFGKAGILDSGSSYFWSDSKRDVLVGSLCSIGVNFACSLPLGSPYVPVQSRQKPGIPTMLQRQAFSATGKHEYRRDRDAATAANTIAPANSVANTTIKANKVP